MIEIPTFRGINAIDEKFGKDEKVLILERRLCLFRLDCCHLFPASKAHVNPKIDLQKVILITTPLIDFLFGCRENTWKDEKIKLEK